MDDETSATRAKSPISATEDESTIKVPFDAEKAADVGAITDILEEIKPIIEPTEVIPEAYDWDCIVIADSLSRTVLLFACINEALRYPE